MSVEFGASIKLDSASALNQMKKFANETSKASKVLKGLQEEVKGASQGLGANTFKKYVDSSRKLTLATKKNIAAIQDQRKTYSKLTDDQKKLITQIDKLNQKYSESARNEAKLIRIKNELQMITGAGLQTKKEEIQVYKRLSEEVRKSTTAYKTQQAEIKKGNELRRAEARGLRDLKRKYDEGYAVKVRERIVRRDLNRLRASGKIKGDEYNKMLDRQKRKIEHITSSFNRMAGAQSRVAKAARLVSIYSRVFLGLYAAGRIGTFIKDLEQTAEQIQLLTQKLEYLTGDSGAYKKLFAMTQEVGIKMQSANKIITRFAVVTNRAFSIDTMNEWASTLIKSARATGTSTQEMTGALIQITQAMSAGRLMGDEYRSVTENLPLLTVALRDMFKGSSLSLKELSSQGLLTTEVLTQGFENLKDMLEGFPDTTDTIEAAFGRLSSSWDNFIFRLMKTDMTKGSLKFFTFRINFLARELEAAQLDSDTVKKETVLNAFRSAEANIDIQQKKLTKLSISATEASARGNKADLETYQQEIKATGIKLGVLYKQKESAIEALKISTGNTDADRALRLAEQQAEAERIKSAIYKEQLRTISLIEKIEKGKTVSTINKKSELLMNELQTSNDRYGAGGVGIDDEYFFELADKIEKNNEETVQKTLKTEIDANLRLRGIKTKFDLDTIQSELSNNSKILEIKKKHKTRVEEVEAAIETGRLEEEKNILPKFRTGTSEAKGKKLIKDLDAKKIKDVNDEILNINNSINSLINSAEQASMTINKDMLGLLHMEQEGIINNTAKDLQELSNNYKQLGPMTEEQTAKYEAERAILIKLREARIVDSDRKFKEGLEDKFSSQEVAMRKYLDSMRELSVAKDRLVVTDQEYQNNLRQITLEYDVQTAKAKALTGELSQMEQLTSGMEIGARNFMESTGTMFDFYASSTEDLLDSSIGLIIDHSKSAQEAFKNLVRSMLVELQKLIIKRSILQAFGGFNMDWFGGGATTGGNPAGTINSPGSSTMTITNPLAVSANGNVFSGPGISAFSGTTVSKPTLFPFAKGVGMMGEAGAEAILPLKRGSDGKLGVTAGNGGGTPVVINNYSQSNVTAETTQGSDGRDIVKIMVDDAISGMVQNGRFDGIMTPYNVSRAGRR